jgi:hypothetical protein
MIADLRLLIAEGRSRLLSQGGSEELFNAEARRRRGGGI